jgi:uncharacterized protein involved in exopolysaccharide biosynthesis
MRERSLLDYWIILSERRFVIYLVIATSVASAVIIGLLVGPVYEARAAFYIPVELPPVSYLGSEAASTMSRPMGPPIESEDRYKPYIGILKSNQLAEQVHARFPRKEVRKLLRSDVDFEVTDEFIVRVYSRDPDPKLAADVANAYLDGLNQILAESSQAQVLVQPAYIEGALARLKVDLGKAEAALKRFEEEHHIASLDTELTELTGQKTSLQAKLDETQVLRVANNSKQKALLAEFEREGKSIVASEVAVTSPLIEHLRVQLTDLLTKLAEVETEFGKKNVEVVVMRNKKQELEQQLRTEITRWASSLIKPQTTHLERLRQQLIEVLIESARLEATEKGNARSLERVSEHLRRYPEIKAEWTNLNDSVVRFRDYEKRLLVSMTEANLQSGRQLRIIVPLDRAEPPQGPAFPIWWLNVLVALLAGLLAGIGYAFFLNYLDETRQVRTSRVVRAILATRGAQPPRA